MLNLITLPCSLDSAGDKMNPFAEQEAWEEHQMGKSSLGISHVISSLPMHLSPSQFNFPLFAGKASLKYGSKNKNQSNDYE